MEQFDKSEKETETNSKSKWLLWITLSLLMVGVIVAIFFFSGIGGLYSDRSTQSLIGSQSANGFQDLVTIGYAPNNTGNNAWLKALIGLSSINNINTAYSAAQLKEISKENGSYVSQTSTTGAACGGLIPIASCGSAPYPACINSYYETSDNLECINQGGSCGGAPPCGTDAYQRILFHVGETSINNITVRVASRGAGGSPIQLGVWNFTSSKVVLLQSQLCYTGSNNPCNFTGVIAPASNLINGSGDFYVVFNATASGGGDTLDIDYATITVDYNVTSDTSYPIFSSYYDNNASLTGSGTALFNVTIANTNGSVWLAINGSNFTATNLSNVYSVSITMANGSYTYNWSAYGNGTSHNFNYSNNRDYTVNATPDNTPPQITINLPLNQSYTSTTSSFNISSNEVLSYCKMTLDNWNTNYSMTLNASSTGEGFINSTMSQGSHTVKFWCNDTSNNINNTESKTFFTDSIAPYVAFITPANTTYTSQTINVNITNGTDAVYVFWSNGTNNLTYTAPVNYNFSYGSHTLYAYANDSSGNLNITNMTFFVLTPQINYNLITPPNLNNLNVTKGVFFNVSVNVSCSGGDCGDVNVSLDPLSIYVPNSTGSSATKGLSIKSLVSTFNLSDFIGTIYNSSELDRASSENSNYTAIGGTSGVDCSALTYTSSCSNIGDLGTCGNYYDSTYNICAWTGTCSAVASPCQLTPGHQFKFKINENVGGINNITMRIATKGQSDPSYLPNITLAAWNFTSSKFIVFNASQCASGGPPVAFACNLTGLISDAINFVSGSYMYLEVFNSPPESPGSIFVDKAEAEVNYIGKGLISSTIGASPFYTNESNPRTINLNNSQSVVVTFFVNATGDIGSTYEFFVNANKTSNLGVSNITGRWNVTIQNAPSSCTEFLANTTKSIYTNISCSANQMNQSRNWTEYDANVCGTFSNLTFYEYQSVNNFLNTTTSNWINTTCSGNNMNQSDFFTEYDTYTCGLNITHYNYQLVGPTYLNTSNSSWFNLGCIGASGFQNETLNWTQYDSYSCASNTTFYAYQSTANASCNDLNYPQFSNFVFNYTNGTQAIYDLGKVYSANATITNTNGTAGIEFGGVNYTANNITPIYQAILGQKAAGVYSYYWWAYGNGTNHNYNTSITFSYTIPKKSEIPILKLNDTQADIHITTIGQVNASASCTYGTALTLYRNSTDVTSQNNIYVPLLEGYYEYEADCAGNENYSFTGLVRYVNVTLVPDTVFPGITIVYPLNQSYDDYLSELSYTFSELYPDSCWYSNNSGVWNSTKVAMGTNFTSVVSINGSNTWTLWCNDTSGNTNSTSVTFYIEIPISSVTTGGAPQVNNVVKKNATLPVTNPYPNTPAFISDINKFIDWFAFKLSSTNHKMGRLWFWILLILLILAIIYRKEISNKLNGR